MADKEQRYVLIAIPETDREETCPFYSVCDGVDDCGVLGLKYNTCKVCNAGMTRAEAIERMKNAGLKYACRANGRDIPEEVHHHYANMMEAALDALLEVK